MKRITIIGGGGVGSFAVPALTLLFPPPVVVTVIDGDTLEKKNLNRQLFTEAEIGHNKAECLAKKYGCAFRPEYFSHGVLEFNEEDVLVCAVDNDPARMACLLTSDESQCTVFMASNETHSSEACVYLPKWRGTPLDPRVQDPTILTNKADDPRRRSIGCTGDFQKKNPQLVTANMMAASLCGHLMSLWLKEVPKLPRDTIPSLPFKMRVNMTRTETLLIKDYLK